MEEDAPQLHTEKGKELMAGAEYKEEGDMLLDEDGQIDVYFDMDEYNNEYGNLKEGEMLDEDLLDDEEPPAEGKGATGGRIDGGK
jgi:hypothetical protein